MGIVKILSSSDLKQLLDMNGVINAVENAFIISSKGGSITPIRTITDLGKEYQTLFYKPSFIPEMSEIGIKILSQKKEFTPGIPTIQGIVLLVDTKTNTFKSIMDGSFLTAIRTGAASGVATKLLSNKNSSVLALFGAGAQGYTQFEAVKTVRDIKKVIIFDLFSPSIDKFIEHYSHLKEIEFVKGTNIELLKEADIICTATNSKTPLFSVDNLKEGVHINAIGSFKPDMREIPDELLLEAKLYVDSYQACFQESGDVIVPKEKNMIKYYMGEIGEYAVSKGDACENGKKVQKTVFKSVGIALQDLMTAHYAYKMGVEKGIGIDIDF